MQSSEFGFSAERLSLSTADHTQIAPFAPDGVDLSRRKPILEILSQFEQPDGEENAVLVGRILAARKGKTSFFDLVDETGRIQILATKQDTSTYQQASSYHQGDIVAVEGVPIVTRAGQPSVLATNTELIAKCLLPLPDKRNGISAVSARTSSEGRVAQLITNFEIFNSYRSAATFVSTLRRFLEDQGFVEFSTPVIRRKFDAGAAQPFATYYNALGRDAFLRLTSEIELKQLLIAGFPKVFEIGSSFRNEGSDRLHNPEFNLLEAYQTFSDYTDICQLTEEMIKSCIQQAYGRTRFQYGESIIDFAPEWTIATVDQVMDQYCGFGLSEVGTFEQAKAKAAKLGIDPAKLSYGQLMEKFLGIAQSNLIDPILVIHFPIEISPLVKPLAQNPRLTERAWLFAGGMDICDIYSDLTDPAQLQQRLKKQDEDLGSNITRHRDNDLIKTLQYGVPPSAGIGLGISRLLMILGNRTHIKDTIPFSSI